MANTQQLEDALRQFDRIATPVPDREAPDSVRQVWRFEFGGAHYHLIFYPRRSTPARLLRPGASALSEFVRLQSLQRAMIPSPRAIAHLAGFSIGSTLGDALIVSAIPESESLGTHLADAVAQGKAIENRRAVASQIVAIIAGLGQARFGHRTLSLDRFRIDPTNGAVLFDDAANLRSGGMRGADLLALAHDASRFASRTELLRAWNALVPEALFPKKNSQSPVLWKRADRLAGRESNCVGRISSGDWTGFFVRRARVRRAWSSASGMTIDRRDWEREWPSLQSRLLEGNLELIKRDASGEIYSASATLAGREIPVIIKRPFRKRWHRFLIDLFRPAKPIRMWRKAWQLDVRDIPCEFPLLVIQRSRFGYALDGVAIFERVPGVSFDRVDLDALEPTKREMLFRRAGRTTRAVELGGLAHYDAKSTNWIVFPDPARGPIPVMIDTDGVRPLNVWLVAWGVQRLLRAMKQHPQYTPADSLAICQGYAPYARGQFAHEDDVSDDEVAR